MKFLFLDVDGVLNCKKRTTELMRLKKKGEISNKEFLATWDSPNPDAMCELKRIVDTTGCKIVLTSSWRLYRDKMLKLRKIFKEYNLKIYGRVKKYIDLFYVKLDKSRIYNLNKLMERTTDRGALIQCWLVENRGERVHKDKFVIVDDELCDIKEYFNKDVLVRTVYEQGGLTKEKADEIIEKLLG